MNRISVDCVTVHNKRFAVILRNEFGEKYTVSHGSYEACMYQAKLLKDVLPNSEIEEIPF